MTPRRLVIVSRVLPFHSAGGMQVVAWDLAAALRGLGASVTVLTTRIPGRGPRFDEEGVEVIALQDAPPRRYGRRWWRGSRDFLMSRLAGVDAVLSVSAGAYGLLSLRAAKPEVRFIMQAHGTSVGEIQAKWQGTGLRKRLASARNAAWLARDFQAYGHFDHIIAVGPRVEAQLRSRPLCWVVPEDRVIRLDNGIDTTRFRPDLGKRSKTRAELGWAEDDLGVVTVSRLHSQKGVLEAIRGFGQFADRHTGTARLLVVGSGPERRTLESEVERTLPSPSVCFFGEASRDDVSNLLNASDVFLFTGLRTEVGLPLNVLEASATGLPLVLSDAQCRDLEFPVEAECVIPSDTAGVAAALGRAAASPESQRPETRVSALPVGRTLQEVAARYAALLFPNDYT